MQKFRIVYVFDALCTWCYGFSPVVKMLYQNFHQQFDFEVISGGLILEDRVGPVRDIAPDNFEEIIHSIESRAKVSFGQPYLDLLQEGDIVYNSLIPATALAVFRSYVADKAPLFAHAIQKKIYFEGQNPNTEAIYQELAQQFDIDPTEFVEKMQLDEFRQKAQYDFALAKQIKATAFPRLFLQIEDTYFYLLAKGYIEYETLEKRIHSIMQEI